MSNTMRALVKAKAEMGLWMENVPVPEPGPNDVLIKVKKSAICGTDVHIWNWDHWAEKTIPVPMVVGHEFVGEIAQVGSSVSKYHVGERVSGEGHIVCGKCRNCRAGRGHLCRNTLGVGVNRPGSFAEFVCIPENNVVPIPDDVPCPSISSARMFWSRALARSALWAPWSPSDQARAKLSSPISIRFGSLSPAPAASIMSWMCPARILAK